MIAKCRTAAVLAALVLAPAAFAHEGATPAPSEPSTPLATSQPPCSPGTGTGGSPAAPAPEDDAPKDVTVFTDQG